MNVSNQTKFIVISGGVISGVGKGVVTASLGKILQEHGYNTTLIKIDPYINFDAGTLRPTEHGEVWVTDDGGEIDQDLGTYERFMNVSIPKRNNITTGQIYKAVIDRERAGGYLGQTVQFMPHIIDEIINRILHASDGFDCALIEVGGTVGDYENAPFLYALKALEQQYGANSIAHILVTYLPIPAHINEMKSRPTRQAIRMLGEHGIIPQFIICRATTALDDVRKIKIQEFAYLPIESIISAPDIESVYQVPLAFEAQKLGKYLLAYFGLTSRKEPDWTAWQTKINALLSAPTTLTIGIVGKYIGLGDYSITDSYLSIYNALLHAGAAHQVKIAIEWIDAQDVEQDPSSIAQRLAHVDGIIVPGGFGTQGVEGKIAVIHYVRTHQIPFLGICYGMQLAAVEYARFECGLVDAHTTEVYPSTPHPIVDILQTQQQILAQEQYGGTMRLGAYPALLQPGTRVHQLYAPNSNLPKSIAERHRHRYEVNPEYVSLLEKAGLCFSGSYERADGTCLMEYLEISSHPFFIATQAHPEFTSRLEMPNPLFFGFIAACSRMANAHKTQESLMPHAIEPLPEVQLE